MKYKINCWFTKSSLALLTSCSILMTSLFVVSCAPVYHKETDWYNFETAALKAKPNDILNANKINWLTTDNNLIVVKKSKVDQINQLISLTIASKADQKQRIFIATWSHQKYDNSVWQSGEASFYNSWLEFKNNALQDSALDISQYTAPHNWTLTSSNIGFASNFIVDPDRFTITVTIGTYQLLRKIKVKITYHQNNYSNKKWLTIRNQNSWSVDSSSVLTFRHQSLNQDWHQIVKDFGPSEWASLVDLSMIRLLQVPTFNLASQSTSIVVGEYAYQETAINYQKIRDKNMQSYAIFTNTYNQQPYNYNSWKLVSIQSWNRSLHPQTLNQEWLNFQSAALATNIKDIINTKGPSDWKNSNVNFTIINHLKFDNISFSGTIVIGSELKHQKILMKIAFKAYGDVIAYNINDWQNQSILKWDPL